MESIYEECLCEELKSKGLNVKNQLYLSINYKGNLLKDKFFRLDILVEDAIIIELKSIYEIHPIDEAQLVSYMKLSNKKLGYLINFNEVMLRDGIRRKVNNYFR